MKRFSCSVSKETITKKKCTVKFSPKPRKSDPDGGIVFNSIQSTRSATVDFIFRIYSKQTDYVILTRERRELIRFRHFLIMREHFEQFNENKLEMKVDVKINLKFAIFSADVLEVS